MSSTPRTSIIMPVYNTASTVVAAIESVLAQTDPDFELL
ncbi:glycosyltransferase, partial [Rothia sp. HMSC072E10]